MNTARHLYFELRDYRGSIALASTCEDVRFAVIFVHGFLGDPWGTWADFHNLIDDEDNGSSSDARMSWAQADLFFYSYNSTGAQAAISESRLRSFIDSVYPTADLISLFGLGALKQDLAEVNLPFSFVLQNARSYDCLILVGHSEGGMIIRRVLISACEEYERRTSMAAVQTFSASVDEYEVVKSFSGAQTVDHKRAPRLLSAAVRLFAPAIDGYRPSGTLGVVIHLPLLSNCVDAVLNYSAAYQDMQPDELLPLRERSERAASDHPEFTALRARILWGEKEKLLKAGRFAFDEAATALGKNHRTVCKPTRSYTLPLEFVCR